jgi:hypothetical protein
MRINIYSRASLRGTKQSLLKQVQLFRFALYSIEIASYLAMTPCCYVLSKNGNHKMLVPIGMLFMSPQGLQRILVGWKNKLNVMIFPKKR